MPVGAPSAIGELAASAGRIGSSDADRSVEPPELVVAARTAG